MRIGIIDYGVGNLGSVARSIEDLSATPLLVSRPLDLHLADGLILPGVGSFGECKRILDAEGWVDAIYEEVLGKKKYLLGICLGMQLLADFGEEGAEFQETNLGLGLVPGQVIGLEKIGCTSRIPHVGWNSVIYRNGSGLFNGIPNGTDFYFVHSYGFVTKFDEHAIAVVDCGTDVVAAVVNDNVWGTQFHPEKSSKAGFQLLRNFISFANVKS